MQTFRDRARGSLAAATVAFLATLIGTWMSAEPSIAETLPNVHASASWPAGSVVELSGHKGPSTEVWGGTPGEQPVQRGNFVRYQNDSQPGTHILVPADWTTVQGDLLSLASGSLWTSLSEFSTTIYNGGFGTLETAKLRIVLYDATGWGGFGFPSSVFADFSNDFVLNMEHGTSEGLNFQVPGDVVFPSDLILVTMQLVEFTGAANGRWSVFPYEPPSVGSSNNDTRFFHNSDVSGMVQGFAPNGNVRYKISSTAPCPPPVINVPTSSFNFITTLGAVTGATLEISNQGSCDVLDWQIEAYNCPWLTFDALGGGTPAGGTDEVAIIVDAFGLPPGPYSCDLEIVSNDPNTPSIFFSVSMNIQDTVENASGGECYATQAHGAPGEFVSIHPTTGAGTVRGNTRVGSMSGLAIDSAGQIFGAGKETPIEVGTETLYRIDAASGAVVTIGDTGLPCFQAMAFSPNDELYAIGDCGPANLYLVDTSTGASTSVAQLGAFMGGLSFDPTTGVLYGTGFSDDTLYTIDTVTGATTAIGPVGGGGVGIGDIHFDEDGNLFGVLGGSANPNSYVSINKSTGAVTVIGPTGIDALTGLDFFRLPCSTPDIAALPEFFADDVPMGGVITRTFDIGNDGCVDLLWSIPPSCSWVTVSPNSGTVPPGGLVEVEVEVDMFGLEPGSYACTFGVESNDPDEPGIPIDLYVEVTGEIGLAASGVLYATQDHDGAGDFVTVDPVTGAATDAGDTRVGGMLGLAINSSGQVFGAGAALPDSPATLYTIDSLTGAVVTIGDTGDCLYAMAFDASDQLYATGGCGSPQNLYQVNTSNGDLTLVLSFPFAMAGLDFDPITGTLYGSGFQSDTIYTLDIVTGTQTALGQTGLSLPTGDITFDASGNLYAVIGIGWIENSLVTLDKATGAATTIGATGIDALSGLEWYDESAANTPDSPVVPMTNALHGASPNPFTQMTQLSFALSEPGHAELTVHDVSGRRVATVLDQRMPAGMHVVPFDADDLSSGTYFYELRMNGYREVRKMAILK